MLTAFYIWRISLMSKPSAISAPFLFALAFCWGPVAHSFAVSNSTETSEVPASTFVPSLLQSVVKALQSDLNILDCGLAEAAQKLAATDLTHSSARAILAEFYAAHTGTVMDVCTISRNGVILAVEPHTSHRMEGSDIRGQDHIQELLATRRPLMSRVFQIAEGPDVVDIEHPVFGTNQAFLGSVSAIFNPATLIRHRTSDLLAGASVTVWAMQPDGRILFDADPDKIGRMLFADPIYQSFPELLQLGYRMAREPKGTGTYFFLRTGNMIPVPRNAIWNTLDLHGTTWRLALTHVDHAAFEAAEAKIKNDATRPFTDNDLRRLAHDMILLRALKAKDLSEAIKRLKQVASGRTDIYSLSWIDETGVNRFGYPPENSLTDVNLRQAEDAVSQACVAALDSRRDVSFEGELTAGGQARFFLVPILMGREYHGALLWIRKIN